MRRAISFLMAAALLTWPVMGTEQMKDKDRLRNCGVVLHEILHVPDDIPQALLNKADCVIVFPSVLKGAFIVGADYGRGAMFCRRGDAFNGRWGAPTMMALEGGSFGPQIGGEATDFVLLVMNHHGARAILESKVKLGGEATVAAGPVGRDAEADTDATMRAEILTYSRSRGLFAGVSLEGSTLRPDNEANERIYGKHLRAREIALHSVVAVPAAAADAIHVLDLRSPRRT